MHPAISRSNWVSDGALLSYGIPLAEVGREASRIAARTLHEQRQPIDFNDEIMRVHSYVLAVNEETALGLGLKIPSDLATDAAY